MKRQRVIALGIGVLVLIAVAGLMLFAPTTLMF